MKRWLVIKKVPCLTDKEKLEESGVSEFEMNSSRERWAGIKTRETQQGDNKQQSTEQ